MEYIYSFLWFMLAQIIFAFTFGQILLPIFVGLPRYNKALKNGEFIALKKGEFIKTPSRFRLFIAPIIWTIILTTIFFFIIIYREGKYYEFIAAFVFALFIFFKNVKSEKTIMASEKDFRNMYSENLV